MHPDLKTIADELGEESPANLTLRLLFGLLCVAEVAGNLESEEAVEAYRLFKSCIEEGAAGSPASPTSTASAGAGVLAALAVRLEGIAASHPGSRSLDGTRHAAVSATYALAKAAGGHALDAAAYAAYSKIYGYGGYAVNDPELFAEEHRRQLEMLRRLKRERG